MAVKNYEIKQKKREAVDNDFLIQFCYSVLMAMLTFYLYQASLYTYGASVGMAMPKVLWGLFGIGLALGIFFVIKYVKNKTHANKQMFIYSFITAAAMFCCIGVQKIFWILGKSFPFFQKLANQEKMMKCVIILILISIPVEIIIYFVRLYKLKPNKTKKGK